MRWLHVAIVVVLGWAADGMRGNDTMVTEDAVLKALDKPQKTYSILVAVDPGGSTDSLQALLMKMRDEGKVKFDINKGNWRKA